MAKVIDIDWGMKRVQLDIKELGDYSIKVGLMGNDEVNGVSVVDYAVYNEFGTRTIWERPFMRKTYDDNIELATKYIEFMAGQMLDGKMKPTRIVNDVGLWYSNKIKATIRDAKNWAVPNSPITVKMKGSTSPLIDTGRMVGAVNYEVNKE